jgi:hypothetical protein
MAGKNLGGLGMILGMVLVFGLERLNIIVRMIVLWRPFYAVSLLSLVLGLRRRLTV